MDVKGQSAPRRRRACPVRRNEIKVFAIAGSNILAIGLDFKIQPLVERYYKVTLCNDCNDGLLFIEGKLRAMLKIMRTGKQEQVMVSVV